MKRFFQPVQKEGPAKKRANEGAADSAKEKPHEDCGDPTKFLSWNANSFLLRLKKNRAELFELINNFDPDVIALQEVRVPAAGRNQATMKSDTNAAREDKQEIMRALSVSPLSGYQDLWSLADSKYGGTGLLVKHCFKPVSVRFSIDPFAPPVTHESDGRVIIAEFKTFRLLNTYVPNNGWKDDDLGFKRRRKWDERIHSFLTQPCIKPLIWCGDLNVSHADIDVSHPDFFQNAKQKGYMPPNQEDVGQPGFTNAEKRRFSKFLSDGKLVDAYRWMHKEQEVNNGFSWSGNPVGKYRGKRMRIDYFLISQQLLGRLVRSDICGSGIELEGFCGSDHSPITLELSLCSDLSTKACNSPVTEVASKTSDSPTTAVQSKACNSPTMEVATKACNSPMTEAATKACISPTTDVATKACISPTIEVATKACISPITEVATKACISPTETDDGNKIGGILVT